MAKISINVNGQEHQLDVDERTPLIYVLRNDLGLKGTKLGCGLEQCGACKVLVDGKAEFSCNTPVSVFENRTVTTIEGIGTPDKLHPIQQAFVKEKAAQCGYCIPGIIMAIKALLDVNPEPDRETVCEALSDNLCRCGTHPQILKAAMRAAKEMCK
ncbi:MAG: Nicotinate dehydrogenase subunit A [Deltaproteobacteria bacterium]|jgi:nicotinate dehydrogenase subunit A|nr:Nicotinate dehydrogenase subunit A [Deltaproteobacteria bacterium]